MLLKRDRGGEAGAISWWSLEVGRKVGTMSIDIPEVRSPEHQGAREGLGAGAIPQREEPGVG